MIGVSLTKSIHAGDLDLTLGGVVIRDGWISPTDFSLTYARLLDDVSRLDENAIDDANKLAEKVSEQSAAGQFAASLQTFTGLIDLIDKSSGGVNIFNFLFNTSGVDLRVLAAEDKQKEVRGSPLMRFVGQDLSGSSGPNTIEGIMNGVIKEKLKIIPNNLVWQLATVAVFNALENEFMKPAINEVDELLSLGVNVTVYNGQLTYARMLSDVSWLDGNAIDDVNKMAGKVKEQTAAGQFATSLQTFTDLLYLIDSKSDSVVKHVQLHDWHRHGHDANNGRQHTGSCSSPLTRYLGRDISTIMNGVIKRKLKIIPKDLVWQQFSLDVYEAMKNDFMRPAINVVDELLSLGVNVTLYNGQRKPLHFCLPYYIPNGFVKAHKNLQHYSILQAGQAVPVDQPCTVLHMIGAIMQSPDV
ncbi:hypothetical protein OsJ_11130 [Oryza sativa Japonica Group]|uniref:Uncharacterized protein n=1 Tax=Oryza sativa subsp. japonica TaxID=39947 RepID=B9F8U4_ORYSJ|nr:hypothetical protein OsJ_11130 [Oryza sativa Japonica Group]